MENDLLGPLCDVCTLYIDSFQLGELLQHLQNSLVGDIIAIT
jgi:hypothetical protein